MPSTLTRSAISRLCLIADLVPGRGVEDAVDANHRLTQALAIGDVADMKHHAERLEQRRFLRRSHERDHLMAAPNQLLHELAAEKSRRARDQVAWHATIKYIDDPVIE